MPLHIYKRGEGGFSQIGYPGCRKKFRTPMGYCVGKKNMKIFLSPNSVLPRVFLYLVSCPGLFFLSIFINMWKWNSNWVIPYFPERLFSSRIFQYVWFLGCASIINFGTTRPYQYSPWYCVQVTLFLAIYIVGSLGEYSRWVCRTTRQPTKMFI